MADGFASGDEAFVTRRSVLAGTAVALPSLALRAPESRSVRLGGPVFLNSDDPAQLAEEHRRLRYGAAYCPAVELRDHDRIRAIERAFKEANVVIAEVGAWKNMLDPDESKRRANLAYVTERCALAD